MIIVPLHHYPTPTHLSFTNTSMILVSYIPTIPMNHKSLDELNNVLCISIVLKAKCIELESKIWWHLYIGFGIQEHFMIRNINDVWRWVPLLDLWGPLMSCSSTFWLLYSCVCSRFKESRHWCTLKKGHKLLQSSWNSITS